MAPSILDATRHPTLFRSYFIDLFRWTRVGLHFLSFDIGSQTSAANMADDADIQYNNSNRAFLQAFIARSILTFEEAKPLLAAIFTAHGESRPFEGEDRYEAYEACSDRRKRNERLWQRMSPKPTSTPTFPPPTMPFLLSTLRSAAPTTKPHDPASTPS